MKKILKLSAILVIMLVTLTGCQKNEPKKETKNTNVDEVVEEELTIDGTGEIKLKEFIESPKIANKSWLETTTDEIKLVYNVNVEKEHNTIKKNGEEFWVHFSEGGYGTERSGVLVEYTKQAVNVKDMYGCSIRTTCQPIIKGEPVPEKLTVESVGFDMVIAGTEADETTKSKVLESSENFMPFIKANNCDSLEDVLIALGMEETDKSLLKAIREFDVEGQYHAEYTSDYGNVSVAYYQDNSQMREVRFDFEDENCEFEYVIIGEMSDGSGTKELTIDISKKNSML